MKPNKFIKSCESVITEHGGSRVNETDFVIDTCFGRLSIKPDTRKNFYSIFMRFMDHDKFGHDGFKKRFDYTNLNRFSLKYNYHMIINNQTESDNFVGQLDDFLSALRQCGIEG